MVDQWYRSVFVCLAINRICVLIYFSTLRWIWNLKQCTIIGLPFRYLLDGDEVDGQSLSEENLFIKLEKKFMNDISVLKLPLISENLLTWLQEIRIIFSNLPEKGNEILLIYPTINQYFRMVEYFLESLFYLHRTTCKLWYVLSGIFTELATKVRFGWFFTLKGKLWWMKEHLDWFRADL